MGPARPANCALVGSSGGCGAGEDAAGVLLSVAGRLLAGGVEVGIPGLPGMATGASSDAEGVVFWGSSQPTASMLIVRQVIERCMKRSKADFLGLD